MDRSEFHAPEAGKVVTTDGGYAAFVPAPLPPRLRYGRELVLALSRADAALGELSGVGSELPDPELLVAPNLRQEALCSSRIEGSRVTLPELLLDDVAAAPPGADRDHLREVRNCFATLQYGVERLAQVPLSLTLLRELHEQLLRGSLDATRTPGEFRTSQNWLGPPGSTLAHATYVPPPVPEMHQALAAWESFLQDRDTVPDLVQCAMVHERFEAIHPFVGGNGRIGRILVTLFLIERGRLAQPLLYLSAWFEGRREQYYHLLQRVRTHGEWEPWLRFFVTGVRETAELAVVQARVLMALRDDYRTRVTGQRLELVDELFRYPCITVPEVQRALSVSASTARRTLHAVEEAGVIAELEVDHSPRVYAARALVDALQRPLDQLSVPVAADGEVLKSGTDERPVERPGDRLMVEALRMIDTAREQDLDLRLTGGLAVRRHCSDLDFAEREYSDIDFVALSDQ
ncbi:MAG TPA: Fic family protein, partial [Thermoleophilia bacterium]|nr:Fic family protein [Thermoleophilia bacterium]